MRHRPALALAVLVPLALAPLAACGDPLGPRDVAGTYVLGSVGGLPLPAVTSAPGTTTVRVLADTLRLGADGLGSSVSVLEIEQPASPGGEVRLETVRWESALRFRVVKGRIEAEYLCGPNALCLVPPHLVARRDGDGLRVVYAMGERVPQLYARAGTP